MKGAVDYVLISKINDFFKSQNLSGENFRNYLSFYKNSLIDYKRLKMAPSKYALNNFKISEEIKITKNCYTHSYPFYKYFLQYMPNLIKNFFFNTYKFRIQKFVFEKLLFHKKKMNIKNEKNKTSYYLGYWQSIKYFKKII